MQKQLIASAKEKGFESHIIGKSVEAKYSNKDFYYLWMCELQKWIREEYGIDLVILPEHLEKEVGYRCSIEPLNSQSYETSHCYSYEQALEEGLKQALKLI